MSTTPRDSRGAPSPSLLLKFLMIVCWGFFCLRPISAERVAHEEMLHDYTKRLWESKDGLPDQTIQAFAQTSDGNLWIGTKGGLLRFDGDRFRTYDRGIAPALLERGVNSLLTARDGALWIGTEGGGLFRYQKGMFRSYAAETNATAGLIVIRGLYQDRGGAIWVGSDQGLFRISGNGLVRIDGQKGVPTIFVRVIAGDSQGNVWVGGTTLLQFRDEAFVREFPLPRNSSLNLITAMTVTRDGTFRIGMMSGLYRLTDNHSLSRLSAISAEVSVLQENTNGTLWVGTVGQGVFLFDGERLSHIISSALPSQTLGSVFEDREANVWLGTRAGLVRLSRTPVRIIPTAGGADSEFETIFRDSDGTIWIAAQTNLFRVRDGVARPYVFPGLPHVRVRTLMRDKEGSLWVGTDGQGLLHLHGRNVERYDSGHGLINDFVRAILQADDGTMWVGTDGGLTHIGPEGSQNFDVSNGLAYFSVTALFEDRTGDLWVGTSRGLSHISHGRIVSDSPTATLKQEQMWTISQDSAGEIWFGASSGLYGWKAGRLVHLSTANGLATNRTYAILQDPRGYVWLSGPTSVSRVAVKSLDDFADGRIGRVHLDEYLSAFDMDSAELYSGMQPSGVIASDGEVWFPSNKGALRIDGSKSPHTVPLQVMIDEVIANGRRLLLAGEIILSPEDGRLEIAYLAIRMRSQEGLRYRYRMEGLEPWTDAAERRSVDYTQLSAGRYIFRVQAYAIDNPEAVSETSLVIVKKPHFYRTKWFLTCCVAAALGLGFLLYRFRLRQMKMRFRAISEERARLAREMHDTLIQGFVGVSTLIEAALSIEASDEALRHELLNYATHQAQVTIEAAREAVWDLRHDFELGATDAGSLCENLAGEFQTQSSVPIRCEVTGDPFVLHESDAHELLMILREALSNALAHGHPAMIDIRVFYANDHLKIEVADNGSGFDVEEAFARKKHFGLIGMNERAKLLDGRIEIRSIPGRGTKICIVVLPKRHATERRFGASCSNRS
jgi:ligand-binding sensor domain-containing protein/signal transduction histidine kinase